MFQYDAFTVYLTFFLYGRQCVASFFLLCPLSLSVSLSSLSGRKLSFFLSLSLSSVTLGICLGKERKKMFRPAVIFKDSSLFFLPLLSRHSAVPVFPEKWKRRRGLKMSGKGENVSQSQSFFLMVLEASNQKNFSKTE